MERLRIGELLVQAKLVTQARLEDALTLQRSQGRKLGHVLVDLGIVTETQLTQALGQQLSVPWVSLHHVDFSRALLDLVPREVAERYCLVPVFVRRVRKQGETLYVAMEDPTYEAAIEAVQGSSKLPVRPMIAGASDIRSAIRVYYETGEPEPAQPGPPPTRSASGGAPPPLPPRRAPAPPPTVALSESPSSNPDTTAPKPEPALAEPATAAKAASPNGDSPDASPDIEASTIELPPRKGGTKMLGLTLLDGTSIQIPTRSRRKRPEWEQGVARGERVLVEMTASDVVKGLGAVAEGADPREVFGDKVPIEALCAALLSLLLKKGLVADWEFVQELREKR